MLHFRSVTASLARAFAVVALVTATVGAGMSTATADSSTPGEIGRDNCLNGAMHLEQAVEQEQAFIAATKRFLAEQRSAIPEGLATDGSNAQDAADLAAWDVAFREAFQFGWIGGTRPGTVPSSTPQPNLQDSMNFLTSLQRQWDEERRPCRDNGPTTCRAMADTGDAMLPTIAKVYEGARASADGVFALIRQSSPAALYEGVPDLLDSMASTTKADAKPAAAAVARFRKAEKRCAKALNMPWPLPTYPT